MREQAELKHQVPVCTPPSVVSTLPPMEVMQISKWPCWKWGIFENENEKRVSNLETALCQDRTGAGGGGGGGG